MDAKLVCQTVGVALTGADQDDFTFLYDLDQHAIHKQVRLNEPKMYNAISVAAGDALYVIKLSSGFRLPHSFH
jgi:hypothetical protein